MWILDEFRAIVQPGFAFFCFDSCMCGSKRPKKTAFLANFDLSEAEYPLQLCQATASLIAFELKSRWLERPELVVKWRLEQLRYYMELSKKLAPEEKALRQTMRPEVESVMRSKRLLLFKQMLSDSGNCDEDLFDCMVGGFPLIGNLPPSGQFSLRWKPALLSIEAWRKSSKWSRKAVVASCARSLEDLEICHKVWQETQEQLKKGWLTGPYTEEQLDRRHGGTRVPSASLERFVVAMIAASFLVNSSTSVPEKLDLEALDQFVGLARFWAAKVSGRSGEGVEPALVGRCIFKERLQTAVQETRTCMGFCGGCAEPG